MQVLSWSFQITSILKNFTVLDNVALAVQARQGHSFRFWKAAQKDQTLRQPAQEILDEVGLGDRSHVLAGNLAHGEQQALRNCCCFGNVAKAIAFGRADGRDGLRGFRVYDRIPSKSQRQIYYVVD